MFEYKDFTYCAYILNLPYKEGISLYRKCLGRFNNKNREKYEDRMFEIWMQDADENKGSFDEYLKKNQIKQEDKQLNDIDAEKEYNRISKNVNNLIKLSKKRREHEQKRKIKNRY